MMNVCLVRTVGANEVDGAVCGMQNELDETVGVHNEVSDKRQDGWRKNNSNP